MASIKLNHSNAIIIALYQKERSTSVKAPTKKLFHAMQIVKSWDLPIEDERMIGICFVEDGVAMQVGTWKYMQQAMSTL